MGKKRAKEKSSREDETSDLTNSSCTHIRKAIDENFLKKTSQLLNWNTCQDCRDEREVGQPAGDAEDQEDDNAPAIWICLRCGHRGCGRMSVNHHALKHFEKPHSDTHCLVLSSNTWSVWCYDCDDEIQFSATGRLAQLVSSIQKQVLSESKRTMTQQTPEVTEDTRVLDEDPPASAENSSAGTARTTSRKNVRKDGSDQNGQNAVLETSDSVVSVRGLSNLGNTCFFNAVVQNLSQTQLFRKVLKEILEGKSTVTITPDISTELEPISIQLEQPGSLTMAMSNLLNEIQDTKKSVVMPRELFTQVCKKAARFKGFQQQDSQELLRYLLDGMRAEETKRMSLGISEALKNSEKNTESDELKKLIKEYEKNGAPKNFVDQVFGGELTSTVMCKECKTVSLVTETFLDLSLSVLDEVYRKKNQKKGMQKSSGDQKPDSSSSVANEEECILSGVGSKYQQKKAKKQAKKQAKNQRRQQKLAGKVFTGQDPPDAEEGEEGAQTEAGEVGEQHRENGSRHGHPERTEEQLETRDPPGKEAGSMSDVEPVTASSVNNRSSALSEEQDVMEEKEDERQAMVEDLEATEEDDLAEELNSLTLDRAFVAPDDIELDLEGGDPSTDAREYTVVNQDPELAFQTLASRVVPEKEECSILSSLFQFTEVENLTKNNSLLCRVCSKRQAKASDAGARKSVYTDALKQMLISTPPPVLTLHLKRFQQDGFTVCKVNHHVSFPQILDLAPFCSVNCKNVAQGEKRVQYGLYGIVEHSGTMRSGHYTAYVKARLSSRTVTKNGLAERGDSAAEKGSWYHVSDTSVQPVPESRVQSSQAYLLFYERIS